MNFTLSCCGTFLLLVAFTLISLLFSLYYAFHRFPSIGEPITIFLVRQQMPRPEQFTTTKKYIVPHEKYRTDLSDFETSTASSPIRQWIREILSSQRQQSNSPPLEKEREIAEDEERKNVDEKLNILFNTSSSDGGNGEGGLREGGASLLSYAYIYDSVLKHLNALMMTAKKRKTGRSSSRMYFATLDPLSMGPAPMMDIDEEEGKGEYWKIKNKNEGGLQSAYYTSSPPIKVQTKKKQEQKGGNEDEKEEDGVDRVFFHRPSLTKYGPFQWLWDSCFHMMTRAAFARVPHPLEILESSFSDEAATDGKKLELKNEKKPGNDDFIEMILKSTALHHRPAEKETDQNTMTQEKKEEEKNSTNDPQGGERMMEGKKSPSHHREKGNNIEEKWKHLTYAVQELLALFSRQDVQSGFIPEMIYWYPDWTQHGVAGLLFGYKHGFDHTDITQMPMLAYAVEEIYTSFFLLEDEEDDLHAHRDVHLERNKKEDKNGDDGEMPTTSSSSSKSFSNDNHFAVSDAFLLLALPKVLHYLRYWHQYRDPDGNHLVSIVHPWESGLDASPLYDPIFGYFNDQDAEWVLNWYRRQKKEQINPESGGNEEKKEHDTLTEIEIIEMEKTLREENGIHVHQSPTPEELYPNFILLLYHYRHHFDWNISKILLHQKNYEIGDKDSKKKEKKKKQPLHHHHHHHCCFNVEDIGVNSVLADNFRVVRDLAEILRRKLLMRRCQKSKRKRGSSRPLESTQELLLLKKIAGEANHYFQWMLDAIWMTASEKGNVHEKNEHMKTEDIDLTKFMNARKKQQEQKQQSHNNQENQKEGPGGGEKRRDSHRVVFPSRGFSPHLQESIPLYQPTIQSIFPIVFFAKEWEEKILSLPKKMKREGGDDDQLSQRQSGKLLLTEMKEYLTEYFFPSLEDLQKTESNNTHATVPPFPFFPAPTTSLHSSNFNPEDSTLMWRGPTWPTTNWFIYRGLQRYFSRSQEEKRAADDDNDGTDDHPVLSFHPSLKKENTFIKDDGTKINHDGKSLFAASSSSSSFFHATFSKIHSELEKKWIQLHLQEGFHEYFNPLSGEGLGQEGLGMSLNIVTTKYFTNLISAEEKERWAARREREDALKKEAGTKEKEREREETETLPLQKKLNTILLQSSLCHSSVKKMKGRMNYPNIFKHGKTKKQEEDEEEDERIKNEICRRLKRKTASMVLESTEDEDDVSHEALLHDEL